MIQRYSQHLNIPPPPVNRLTRGATQQQNLVRSSCVSVVSPPSSAPAGCRGSDSGSGDGEDAHQDGAQPRPPPPQRGERPALLSLSLSRLRSQFRSILCFGLIASLSRASGVFVQETSSLLSDLEEGSNVQVRRRPTPPSPAPHSTFSISRARTGAIRTIFSAD
jgi:hypothetical protein